MSLRETIITSEGTAKNYWLELWEFRELFLFLAWRDILSRYKQTLMGVAWAIIRPLVTVFIFSVLFGTWGKFPANGVPYPILVFSGMLPWQFFSSTMASTSESLVGNANLITKVYFPRLVIPISSVLAGSVDFIMNLLFFCLLCVFYDLAPTWRLVFCPLFLFWAFLISVGAGLWFAALNVKYRDFRHMVPFLAQIGTYVSPVGFISSIVPHNWKLLYSLNPLVGVIDGFRWSIHPNFTLDYQSLFLSGLIGILVFSSGLWFFRKTENTIADAI